MNSVSVGWTGGRYGNRIVRIGRQMKATLLLYLLLRNGADRGIYTGKDEKMS